MVTEFSKYINANFPNIEPCCNCEYWRYITSSGDGQTIGYYHKYNASGKKKPKNLNANVACHYNIDNDVLKPDNAQHMDGTCDCFRTRDNHYKKICKKKIYR